MKDLPFVIILSVTFLNIYIKTKHFAYLLPIVYMFSLVVFEVINLNKTFLKVYSGLSLIVILCPIVYFLRQDEDWYDEKSK